MLDDLVDAANLPGGKHLISFQFFDKQGQWSGAVSQTYTKGVEPLVSIAASASTVCANSPVSFTADVWDADVIEWDFGDGTKSSEFSAVHSYSEGGSYQVTAIVTNTDSLVSAYDTIYGGITVNPTYHIWLGEVDTISHDSFENETTNSAPSDWMMKYEGTGVTNQIVVESPVKNGQKAFQMEGASGWASEFYKRYNDLPDKVTLEAWVNCEKTLSGLAGSIGLGNFSVGSWGTRTSRLQFNAGKISATYSGGSTYEIMDYTPGVWYHMRMVHDLVNLTYQVFIDGTLMTGNNGSETTSDFPMHPTVATIDVMLAAGNSGTNKMFFDDILLTKQGSLEVCENTLPFVLGTQNIVSPGTYTETFSSVDGCDSIVSVELTITDVDSTTISDIVCESELPYAFGTQSITTSGVYIENFPAVSGCDSVVTLNLAVKDSFIVEVVDTVCSSELPYTFGTQSLTAAGEYTETFTAENGCDSTVNLTLNVNPAFDVAKSKTICDSDLPYTFGTQSLVAAGEYTETFSAINNCDSIVTLTLNVNSEFNEAASVNICESELPYTFGTQSLPGAGEFTETFASVSGCDSTVTLTLTVNPEYDVTKTITICSNELPYSFGTQSLNSSGEFSETFITSHGCDSTVTLNLTVNQSYNENKTVSICENEIPYLLGSQSLTTTGEYSETFTAINGCDSVVTLNLTVNPDYELSSSLTIYTDEIPYEFGTQSLNTSGDYSETFSSISGCDSLVHLTLTVLEKDITPPNAVCQSINISLNSAGHHLLTSDEINLIATGSTDNQTSFENLILEVIPERFNCGQVGEYVPVEVLVTDEEGNTDTCQTTIHVTDPLSPQVTCEPTTIALNENGEVDISPEDLCDSFYDACGISSILISKKHFTCNDLGENRVIVFVMDKNANTTQKAATFILIDDTAPEFVSVNDLQVITEEGKCSTQIDYPDISATDNCGVENIKMINGLGAEGEFPVGANVEQWVATDASGNTDTLTFKVIVSDNPAMPSMSSIENQTTSEDADPIVIPLSGVYDGQDCKSDPLELDLSYTNGWLIDKYQIDYVQGEDNGILTLSLAADESGESEMVLTLTNNVTGKQTTYPFQLNVVPVNDPPILVTELEDISKTTKDTLLALFPSAMGVIFDDPDIDDQLQISVTRADGNPLPEWLVFRNDSLLEQFPGEVGCMDLLVKAVDLKGSEVSTTVSLCLTFQVGVNSKIENPAVLVYPNPTSGKVFLSFQGINAGSIDVSVFDLIGRKVLSLNREHAKLISIDLSNQLNGVYLLQVDFNGKHKTFKLTLNQ